MKAKVVTLEQGRKRVAEQKESVNRDRLAQLLACIWQQTLERIEAEFPEVGVVGVQYDILQTFILCNVHDVPADERSVRRTT